MIPGLKAGKFDVIMDGMSITDERKKEIDFSRPYAAPPAAFMAAKDSPVAKALGPAKVVNAAKDAAAGAAAIKSVQAALKGKTIGVQVSTTHANFASKYLKDIATVKEYKTTDERDLDLKSGRIDVALDDYPPIAAALEKPDAKDFVIAGPEFIGDVFGVGEAMGLRKTDADLTAKFNKALDAAFADGSVKKYSMQWFKIDTTP
jgi:octopine/nopaline transport system substrate-binding protein